MCKITTFLVNTFFTATWYCFKITPWSSFFEMACVVFMVSDKLTRTSLVYTVVHVAAAVSLFAACTCLHSKQRVERGNSFARHFGWFTRLGSG